MSKPSVPKTAPKEKQQPSPAKQVPEKPTPAGIPLSAVTITWGDGSKKCRLPGPVLERVLDVMRWTGNPHEDPEHGGDFWPMASPQELGFLVRGIAQLLGTEGGFGAPTADECDCRDGFLASAQMLLSACLICYGQRGEDGSTSPEFYYIVDGRTAKKGGRK